MFANKYGDKYNKAVACLTKDREALLALGAFVWALSSDRLPGAISLQQD